MIVSWTQRSRPTDWSIRTDRDLTPETPVVETFLDVEAFAPLWFARFDSVTMDHEPVCASAIAAN